MSVLNSYKFIKKDDLDFTPSSLNEGPKKKADFSFSIQQELENEQTFTNLSLQFRELGNLQKITPTPERTDQKETQRDDKGNIIEANYYLETKNLLEAAEIAQKNNLGISLIGSLTSAIQAFGNPKLNYQKQNNFAGIILIKATDFHLPEQINNDELLSSSHQKGILEDSDLFKSNTFLLKNIGTIQEPNYQVTVGGGFTPSQINQILELIFLEDQKDYCLPLDLTTKNSAKINAVAATNGTGPNRISPDQLITEITIVTKNGPKTIKGEELKNHIGLLGLSGAIINITFNILEKPKHRFAIPLALKDAKRESWHLQAAKALSLLQKFTERDKKSAKLQSKHFSGGIIDGVEVLGIKEIENIMKKELLKYKEDLLKNMEDGDSETTLLITGYSDYSIEEILYGLSESKDTFAIEILNLIEKSYSKQNFPFQISEMYFRPDQIKKLEALRENIPEAAREKARDTSSSEKSLLKLSKSTDLNSKINPEIILDLSPEELTHYFNKILQPYINYQNEVEKVFKEIQKSFAEINQTVITNFNLYGHANPENIDFHCRPTVISSQENKKIIMPYWQKIMSLRQNLYSELLNLRNETLIQDNISKQVFLITFGEKGPITAEGWKTLSPQEKEQRKRLITESGCTFNYRTPNYISC